ncbi:MAG: PilZ domain-containing protein [Acidobacteria bacterium]|jgi:hypothetical protein|nr:PilZ domain-containing protein [Acidobacteriota bacterium]
MKKRKEARIQKSLLVEISRKGLEQMGVTLNISRRGMCIATTGVVRKSSRLQILLAAADDIYAVTGLVVWKKKKQNPQGEEAPVGLGIQIEKAPRAYLKYLNAAGGGSPPSAKGRNRS